MDFNEDQERVLVYLVSHQCVSVRTAKRLEAIERDLGSKVGNLALVLQDLSNARVIGVTKKGSAGKLHYYASTAVLGYLKRRGLWSPGRIHRL